MITNIDENFGRLKAALDRLGIADDTILVFMTDNGSEDGIDIDEEEFPMEGEGSFNAGMRGKKCSPYEGGHRVPLVIRHPSGGIDGGREVDTLASYVDFMPTLVDLCGVEVPAGRKFHGRSLVPLLNGKDGPEWLGRTIVADTQRIARPMKWRKSCVMKERWRLVNGTELYDIAEDPGQRTDVAAGYPDIVRSLRRSYDEWWVLVSEQFARDVPIALGADEEPVKLTTHDIRNEACEAAWNQGHVRAGRAVSGYWEVDVRKAGRYAVELRRWPEEAGHAVGAGIDGDDVEWRRDCIAEGAYHLYTGGVALDIRWAQLTVGGRTYQREVDPRSTGAVFSVVLAAGVDHLYAAFHDLRERTMAPYYVYVRPTDHPCGGGKPDAPR